MKALLFCLCMSFALGLTAQSTSVSEKVSDKAYRFHLSTDTHDAQTYVDAFSEIGETDVHPDFRGDWTTHTEAGIKISMHTRRKFICVEYRGNDREAMAAARAKANVIRKYFDLEKVPTTPGH